MRVLFVNAAGYGNIGDDTYPIIFKKYFSKQHDLFFMNSDIEPIPENLDLIVFGGGGLIFDKPGEKHLEYMERYLKHAVKNKIKYGFISVGIQCRKYNGSNEWDYDSYAFNWVKWFYQCAFASFRDKGSLEYFKEKLKRKDFIEGPDLCYLFEKKIEEQKDYVLVIPGAKVNKNNPEVIAQIENEKEVIFMNMGGRGTDGTTLEFKEIYEDAKFYLSDDLFPSLAFKLISEARRVITGRYHGLVFSRVASRDFWINSPSQYKIEVEELGRDYKEAICHILLLERFLA